MINSFKIRVIDRDPDCLKIDISSSNGRFSGAAEIYAGLHQPGEFIRAIKGFPKNLADERKYVIGTKNKNNAAGFCSLRIYCRNASGHIAIDLEFEDDNRSDAAKFTLFPVLASDIDQLVVQLKLMDDGRLQEARLGA